MDYDTEMLPEESLCKRCRHRICRLVEFESGEQAYHNSCLLLDIDIHDHVVRSCNRFEYDIRLKWRG